MMLDEPQYEVLVGNTSVGRCILTEGKGWRYHPIYRNLRPSRRYYGTPEAALYGRVAKYRLVEIPAEGRPHA